MIDAIEESRMELRGTMLDFEDETEQLRAESRMLGEPYIVIILFNRTKCFMLYIWTYVSYSRFYSIQIPSSIFAYSTKFWCSEYWRSANKKKISNQKLSIRSQILHFSVTGEWLGQSIFSFQNNNEWHMRNNVKTITLTGKEGRAKRQVELAREFRISTKGIPKGIAKQFLTTSGGRKVVNMATLEVPVPSVYRPLLIPTVPPAYRAQGVCLLQ